MQTVIITIGLGPNGKGQYPPEEFNYRTTAAILSAGYDIAATIHGTSYSDWGTELATWFSVIGDNHTNLGHLKANLDDVRAWSGQDAIGIVVDGQYDEITA